MEGQAAGYLWEIGLIVVSGAIGLAGTLLSEWIRTKTNNDKMAGVVKSLADSAIGVVNEVEKVRADKFQDKKLTIQEQREMVNHALDLLRRERPKAIEKLGKLAKDEVNQILLGIIEKAQSKDKQIRQDNERRTIEIEKGRNGG